MAPWVCSGGGCGTAYSLRLSRCPRCHGTEFVEEQKLTRHGGAADQTLPAPGVEAKGETPTSESSRPASRKAARTQARR